MSDSLAQPPSAQGWVNDISTNSEVDTALAAFPIPAMLQMKAVVDGTSPDEALRQEQAGDPVVAIKSRLLGLLAGQADNPETHVRDLLALMDRQATASDSPNETRYRQFMGLWDIAIALSRDTELVQLLSRIDNKNL